MSVDAKLERISVQLEQLEDVVNEHKRLELLELEPSEQERQDLVHLANSIRSGFEQCISQPKRPAKLQTLVQTFQDLLPELEALNVSVASLELPAIQPAPQPDDDAASTRSRKVVRFSDVREEFEPANEPYSDNPQELRQQYDVNNSMMFEQDMRLESLGRSVRRQHQVGTNINQELDGQLELLDDLEAQTDRNQSSLDTARNRVEQFNRKARENGSCLTITLLTLILFILLLFL